jgi:hypothetical protein
MLVLSNDYDMMKVFLFGGEKSSKEIRNQYNTIKSSVFDFKTHDS